MNHQPASLWQFPTVSTRCDLCDDAPAITRINWGENSERLCHHCAIATRLSVMGRDDVTEHPLP